ncbi:MAG: AAA family ATPase [Chloroflexota bacterium]
MDALTTYIPMDRRLALNHGKELPDRTTGAVLFADISGFTTLTEALVHEFGPRRGAEEVTRQLNLINDARIAEVHRYGGSVIGFVGDGLTCWFDDSPIVNGLYPPDTASYRATACALAMQQAIAKFDAILTSDKTPISLQIKVCVIEGPARRFLVGYPNVQTIDVLAGTLLDRISSAEEQLNQGEVIIGDEIFERFGAEAEVSSWRTADNGEQYAVVTKINSPIAPKPWPNGFNLPNDITREWLLPTVYQKLQRGEEDFLADLRPAVALLLQFTGIDYDRNDAGAKLDLYIRWVQTVLERFGGALIQLTIGDKGSFLYATFGAPLAHDDDNGRAVAAALALQEIPDELSFIQDISIGLTQGQMRAGAYGGSYRKTYGVIGNQVNIAARLMSRAKPSQILVTQNIVDATRETYLYQSLGSMWLKGLNAPLPIFALDRKRQDQTDRILRGRSPETMVGRVAERALITRRLKRLVGGESTVLLIDGEAGIGKSRLVADLIQQAQMLGVSPLIGSGSAIEQTTPYQAWRSIFRTLFDIKQGEDTASAQQKILARLPDDPYMHERLPLLNAILPFNWPDNELTSQMDGDIGAGNTRDLLARTIATTIRPTTHFLIILEDAHWLDSASWALAERIQREIDSLMLVIVTRPVPESNTDEGFSPQRPLPPAYKRLSETPHSQQIHLKPLKQDEVLELICQRLEIDRLPDPLSDLILRRTEGHPFFAEEIAYTLRDSGFIQISGGEAVLTAEADALQAFDFPNTVQGVITSRIDHLPAGQQMVLKVASVIGRTFQFRVLKEIHPLITDKPDLANHLDTLARLDITPVQTAESELTYSFKHAITQEVAYQLMISTQRQQLHCAVAEWLEQTYAQDLTPHYSLLAHHWLRTIDEGTPIPPKSTEKILFYLEKAGEQALKNFANQEAIRFFEQAIALSSPKINPAASEGALAPTLITIPSLKRIRWERQLGTAYRGIGRLADSRDHSEKALALLGQPLPKKPKWRQLEGVLAFSRFALWPLKHYVWPNKTQNREDQERLLERLNAYFDLGYVFYHHSTRDRLLLAQIGTEMLTSAEAAGDRDKLAFLCSAVSFSFAEMSFERLAEIYGQLALDMAQELGNTATMANVLYNTSMQPFFAGQWVQAENRLHGALDYWHQLGDWNNWEDTAIHLAHVLHHQAKFVSSAQFSAIAVDSAQQRDNVYHQLRGLRWHAQNLLALSQPSQLDEAVQLLENAITLPAEDPGWVVSLYALLTTAYWQQGAFERAEQTLHSGLGLVEATGHSAQYRYFASMLLTLWEIDHRSELAPLAQQAYKAWHSTTKRLRIHQPTAWRFEGIYHYLNGHRGRAYRAWRLSLTYATKLGMPYEEALTLYEMGRHLPMHDFRRTSYLKQAMSIFTELKTTYDLAQAKNALEVSNIDVI